MNGMGKMTSLGGKRVYEGSFKDNEKHGNGKETLGDG